MDALSLLGADPLPDATPARGRPPSLTANAVAIAAGAAAAFLARRSHPVLAFVGGAALAGNAVAVARGERTLKEGAKRIGRHAVAAAGSLAMPTHPLLGYVAGAFAADLILDGHGGGIAEEWAVYAGIDLEQRPPVEVKAEVLRDDTTKAVVLRRAA